MDLRERMLGKKSDIQRTDSRYTKFRNRWNWSRLLVEKVWGELPMGRKELGEATQG